MVKITEGIRTDGVYSAAEEDEGRMNWHKIAHEPREKQGMYCSVLQAYVRICKLVSCRHYTSCHGTVRG
ncbi:MAG: hypothetical protein OIN66_05860 [Candidatus Methanoperedens sp.]|nr:hypothetical protein [Candidatus Methanoperedens sp.]